MKNGYSRTNKTSKRKLRLFACACCRRIWHLLPDERSREAVVMSERFAEGLIRRKDLSRNRERALQVTRDSVSTLAEFAAASVARASISPRWIAYLVAQTVAQAQSRHSTHLTDLYAERRAQVALLQEVVGNPFRPVSIDPAWRQWNAGAISHLAESIYEQQQFTDMPFLADALEEAGCSDEALLTHCRQPGEHVRGCWALDLILGKS
jgi:hypothetical protein